MEEIKISVATVKDRKQLLIWFNFYGDKKLIEKRVDCYLGCNSTVIAKDKDKIVGVLQWHVKESAEHGLAEIEEVLISESCRGQGTGSLLVTYAIDAIRDYFIRLNIRPRKIFLFVGKENTPARKLYEKHGFRMINSIGFLFNDSVEELFYSLDVAGQGQGQGQGAKRRSSAKRKRSDEVPRSGSRDKTRSGSGETGLKGPAGLQD